MIVISKLMKEFIESQTSVEDFAKKLDVSRQTVYNILKGDEISSNMMDKLLQQTGLTLDNAFEVKND